MTEADGANKLMRLPWQIAHHSQLYYVDDEPEIFHAEYDALVRRNAELDAAFLHLIRADCPIRMLGREVAALPRTRAPK